MLHLLWFVVAMVVVLGILLVAEGLRGKQLHAELTRKFVHAAVGTFVAFWPFFLSWRQIEFLSLAFLVVVAVSLKFHIFQSVHDVQRNAVGELLFAVVIGLLAGLISSKWIFMAAMLHLSLADGLAAVVGLLAGDRNQYKVFGRVKSIAGSVTFFVVSVIVLMVYSHFSHADLGVLTFVWLPLLATVVENLAVYGTDNIAVPLMVALVLNSNV